MYDSRDMLAEECRPLQFVAARLAGADDDAVILRQFIGRGDRRGLIEFEVVGTGALFENDFRNRITLCPEKDGTREDRESLCFPIFMVRYRRYASREKRPAPVAARASRPPAMLKFL
ncbi:hypothetical protein AA101099_2658 [Neoasaia chiangmaiensis NBRC 101099]|nr:hypothetical protein AA101099_2658 [Neoasaia chiangmaiensis NBRC 101099]GEN14265.1 hypothetical protein NCH01_06960 [Neoasaia chiangmaiensis]